MASQSSRMRPRAAALIASLAGLSSLLAGCDRPQASAAARPLPEVVVAEAVARNVAEQASPIGTTRSLQKVILQARVRGFLEEIHFTEGSTVKPGQLLFVIEEEPYKVARDAAKAKLDAAEAALAKAKQSRAREVSEAQLALDRAQLSLAKVQEQRVQTLFARNAAAKGDLDQAQADLEKWTAQVAGDSANFEQAKSDFDTNIRSAQADVDAAKAALRDAEINLGYCRVHAPIEGRIGEARLKVGNLVGSTLATGLTTDLATIQQLDPMGVDIEIPSRYLDRATRLIAQGLPATITRPGLDGEPDRPRTGVVNFIDNQVDSTTSTVRTRAEVPNPDGALLPGEYVKASLVVGERKGVVVVPESAVVETQAGPTVYEVDKDDTVRVVPVKGTMVTDGLRVIDSGLEPGRRVIVEGIQLVRPNTKVKTRPLGATSQAKAASL